MPAPKVFISYSHQDEEWKNRLVRHLRVLQLEGHLEIWNDRQITAGDDWRSEIESAMAGARVAVMLISADFLTSGFIRGTEVPRLLERQAQDGLRIVPLIVQPCPWLRVPWLARIQARPKDGRPLADGSAVQIERDLSCLAEEIADLLSAEATPGPGSAGQDRGEADLRSVIEELGSVTLGLKVLTERVESLFRRLEMVSRAESLVQLRTRLGTDRLRVVVCGELRCGKSTLVNALLSSDVIPRDSLPYARVLTSVCWGSEKKAFLHFREPLPRELPSNLPPDVVEHLRQAGTGPISCLEISADRLRDYFPGPDLATPYSRVEIRWPLELCQNGVEMIDTPGPAAEYLQDADVVLFMTFPSSFGSVAEQSFVDGMRSLGHDAMFFVCNGWDRLEEGEREETRQRILAALKESTRFGEEGIFFLSALEALRGRLEGDPLRVEASGIISFEQALARFLPKARGLKLSLRAREISWNLQELQQEIIPAQRQACEEDEMALMAMKDRVERSLGEVEKVRQDVLRHMVMSREQLRFHVQKEAHALFRRLIEEAPSWVDEMGLEQFVSTKTAEHVRERVITRVRAWVEKTAQPLVDDWVEGVDTYIREESADTFRRAEITQPGLRLGEYPSWPDRLSKMTAGYDAALIDRYVPGAPRLFRRVRERSEAVEELRGYIKSVASTVMDRLTSEVIELAVNLEAMVGNALADVVAMERDRFAIMHHDEASGFARVEKRRQLLNKVADETAEIHVALHHLMFKALADH
jgi:hypothetical protein